MKDNADALFDLVTARPDPSLFPRVTACPYCASERVTRTGGARRTLLGWNGIGDDPNHAWKGMGCLECGETFTHETKAGNGWITDGSSRVLAGFPSCFEYYTYVCARCGGNVTHDMVSKETGKPVSGYSIRIGGKSDAWKRYTCDGCGASVDVEP